MVVWADKTAPRRSSSSSSVSRPSPDASSLRQGGTEAMLEGLAKYLA